MNVGFITQRFRLSALAVLLSVALGSISSALAQPVDFGSSDDPRERLQTVWWRHQSSFQASGGLSLISDHWRAGVNAGLDLVSRPLTARVAGTVRGGIYGRYEPDTDEWYDLLRTVEFARYNAPLRSPLYLRAGLLDRLRIGTGHVVNFFNSHVAWDERTVGAEGMYRRGLLNVAGFTDNVLINGVVGGRVGIRPLFWSRGERYRSIEVGLNYITDLDTRTKESEGVTAYNVDVSAQAVASGEVRFVPFASYAWYPEYGRGLGFGASVESDNFIEFARFRFRMALFYSGEQFIPGYVGSFYQVSNPFDRILDADKYLRDKAAIDFEGVELKDAAGGNDLETELRVLIFERFEFWYFFRRHYGTQSLGEYHLRLYFNQPGRLRVNVGMDRGGLKSVLSLFNSLGNQSALVFGTDYRVLGPFWVFIHARYTFEEAGASEDGTKRYLVQRRFEPFTGFRIDF